MPVAMPCICGPPLQRPVGSKRTSGVSKVAPALHPAFFEAPRPAASRADDAHRLYVEGGRRLLPLMSDYVASQALVARFEQLAGRSAMIGFGTALVAELLLPSSGGLFGWAAGSGLASQLAALGTFMLCCSVGLAARTQGPLYRHRLLEPVIASLTAQRRAASGVTQKNVDKAVDQVVDSVFTQPFMREHFPVDTDFI